MKIDIVTLHDANNYGSACQGVATRQVFARFGEARIVNYRNRHVSHHLRDIRFDPTVRGVLRTGKDLLRLPSRRLAMARFREFLAAHGGLTEPVTSLQEVAQATAAADVLVSGSDQIWNPACVSGDGRLDPVYFLAFARPGQTKISYASSYGAHVFTPAEAETVRKHLLDYRSLSAREDASAVYLAELLGRDVACTLDPTLLLDTEEWRRLARPIAALPARYVLAYVFDKTARIKCALARVAAELSLPVVVLDQDLVAGLPCDVHVRDAGPAEFVHAFLHADYVVSDSFHGACFATNFDKPLLAVARPGKSNRVESLMRTVGNSARVVYSDVDVERIAIRYENPDATAALARARQRSLDYIVRALGADADNLALSGSV